MPGSGENTPNGHHKKKSWGFLGMNSNQASSVSLDMGEKGEKTKRPKSSRHNSWDLLGDRAEWEEYNPSQAKNEKLRFAEGDVGTNKVCRILGKHI